MSESACDGTCLREIGAMPPRRQHGLIDKLLNCHQFQGWSELSLSVPSIDQVGNGPTQLNLLGIDRVFYTRVSLALRNLRDIGLLVPLEPYQYSDSLRVSDYLFSSSALRPACIVV